MCLSLTPIVRTEQELRRIAPTARILAMVPPPLFPPFPWTMNATVLNDIFPTLIRDIATVAHLPPVVDVHTALKDYAPYTCDGCHPNPAGYAIVAQTVADAILQLFPEQRGNIQRNL